MPLVLTMVRSKTFDLLLIDQRLPDMLGTDLIRTVRADVANVPFVLMSGWLETPVTVNAMKLGASTVSWPADRVARAIPAAASSFWLSMTNYWRAWVPTGKNPCGP